MTNDLQNQALELATRLAREAGTLAMSMRGVRVVDYKGTVDLVTDADRAAEALIASGIREAFPEHRLQGEEGAVGAEGSPWRWLIDPIDGTTNYAHGYPQWAVSICLERDGEPVVGVVFDPEKDELFAAKHGSGATLNGEPIRVSGEDVLIRALCASGFSYDIDGRDEAMTLWREMHRVVQGMRRDGAAALDMCWVACGRLDAYWERPIHSHDIGAGVIIAREAGGTVSAYDGGTYELDGNEVCCSNTLLHAEIVTCIGKALRGA